MFNKYFRFYFLMFYLNFFVMGYPAEDLRFNNSALMLLQEMISRQYALNQLDAIKNTMEQINYRPNLEEAEDIRDLSIFDIRIDTLPEKCQTRGIPTNCAEATACTKRSGYYYIKLEQLHNDTILVECDIYADGGTWTVIQRRQDGSLDFYRPWVDYVASFGDIDGEFFIGLEKLYVLTNFYGPQELMILMENTNGTQMNKAYAKYDSFAIGPEYEKYMLKRVGKYSGTAGDSLLPHIGCKFSTKDQDNDNHATNCAQTYMGAWWYNKCHWSNLNGHYADAAHGKGLNWYTWSGHTVSMKYVKMMIRRRKSEI